MQVLVESDVTRVVEVPVEGAVEYLEKLFPDSHLVANGLPLRHCVPWRIEALPRLRGGALLGKPVKGRSKIDFEDKFMRQREYDAQHQKYQQARVDLKKKMEQEKVNAKMNRLKIQNQWRKIMRLAKVESLRKGVEILSQNHERDVDRKDAIIQMLDRDLEEAEDQFQLGLRSHLQNMDELIDLQDARLLTAEREFQTELKLQEADFIAERDQITKQHAMETAELHNLMATVEAEEQEREAEAKQEHEQLREEIRNRNLEEINMLRIHLDTQIEQKEADFDAAHLAYLEQTNQRTLDFKYYTKKDQELSKQIDMKIRKIERLQSSLSHWRSKLQQNSKECSQRNSRLLEEKSNIQSHFQQLKSRMNKFRARQATRLAALTRDAHDCKARLNSRLELGKRILLLAELARKSETEQEKVIPFDDAKPDGLDNFLRKYNKVLLDKLAIEKERERLETENANLQSLLKQYFDGVSVNDDVLSRRNPLFVVNGNFKTTSSSSKKPPTVVEANHLVETSRVNTSAF